MPRFISNSLALAFLLMCGELCAQEVISNVSLEKTGASTFRVRYSLKSSQALQIEDVLLTIYRRREGSVEEIFSDFITPEVVEVQGLKQYSYNWKAEPLLIKTGDELQAKITLDYKPALTRKTGNNQAPHADAGSVMEVQLPLDKPLLLDGSRSFDEDGKIVKLQWKQIAGPAQLRIAAPDSSRSAVQGDLIPGTYAFELSVTDNNGTSSVSRTILNVKAPAVVFNPPADQKIVKADPAAHVPKQAVHTKPATRLRGGPLNTVINLLVPGLGHYFVSGDYYGKNRKPWVFGITALYAGAIGGGFYFQSKSDAAYARYQEMVNYREYQRDPAGIIIGVRGADQNVADGHLREARSAHRNALIALGVAGGILVGDAVYTFLKGSKNRKAWKKSASAWRPDIFFSADGNQLAAGLQLKF